MSLYDLSYHFIQIMDLRADISNRRSIQTKYDALTSEAKKCLAKIAAYSSAMDSNGHSPLIINRLRLKASKESKKLFLLLEKDISKLIDGVSDSGLLTIGNSDDSNKGHYYLPQIIFKRKKSQEE